MGSKLNDESALFSQLGYCVVRGVLDSGAVARFRASVESMAGDLDRDQRPESLVEPQIHAPDWRDWLDLCRDERLLRPVRAALGSEEVLMLSSHVLAKPPRDGLEVAWHQDNTYWPGVHGSDVLTAWIALDDVDLENGCMRFLPRSQEGHPELEMLPTQGGDLLGVRVQVDDDADERSLPIELSAGDVSLHDSFLIHSSAANRSDRWRVAYTVRYADALTTRVDTERHGKPVYLVSGSGAFPRRGFRDIRAGRSLPDDPGRHLSNRSRRFREL